MTTTIKSWTGATIETLTGVLATEAEVETALSDAGYRPVNDTSCPGVWITRDGQVARVNAALSDEKVRGEYPVTGYCAEVWSMHLDLLAYWTGVVYAE